jgi:hypothetical protein
MDGSGGASSKAKAKRQATTARPSERTWYLYDGGKVRRADDKGGPDERPKYECCEGDERWREIDAIGGK